MKTGFIKKIKTQNIVLLFMSLIGFLFIMYADKNYLNIHVFQYGKPNFGFKFLIRSSIIFICVAMLFMTIINLRSTKEINSKLSLNNLTSFNKMTIKLTILLSLFFLFLSVNSPNIFSNLSKEDNIIEWGSAFFLFGASLVFYIVYLKSYKSYYVFKHYRWLSVCFSLAFFVIAMEEVSWFQRVIGFGTPEAFNKNLQEEVNLHNFNTNYSENIYYFGSFIFLVILPYFNILFPKLLNIKSLNMYIPSPFIMLVGIIPCSYNFDRWDALTTQFTFFSCILILTSFLFFKLKKKEKIFISFLVVFIIIQQIVFLGNEANLLNMYDIKEYKELFIPICFFIYSFDMFSLMKRNDFSKN